MPLFNLIEDIDANQTSAKHNIDISTDCRMNPVKAQLNL
jgi:hypothetical protein